MHKSNIAAFVLVAVCFVHLCAPQIDAGNEEESSPDNADVTIEDVEIQAHESKNLESLNISAPIDAETSGKDGATDKSADDQSTFSFLTTTLAPLTSFLFGYPSPGDRENINNAENAGDAVTVAGFLKNDLPGDVKRQESLAEDTGNKDDAESLIRSLFQDQGDSSPPESSSPADNTSSERETLPSNLQHVVNYFEKASAGQDNTSSTITNHDFSPADNSGEVPSTRKKTRKVTQDSPGFAKRKLWMPLSKLGKKGKKHEQGTKPLLSKDVLLEYEKGLLSNVSELYASDSRQYPANGPNLGDLARYMKTCENCLTTEDAYQCPLHDSAIDLKNWMTVLDALITNGCQNKDDCGVGSRKCCHSKNPALERALREMTAMVRDMYNIFLDACSNCPRNGGWTSWCEWSSCSASCGPGVRTRSRECNNPTPKGGGKDCPGEKMSTEPCKGPDCCTDGNWSPWSAWGDCSATCGSGTTVRSRTCSSPPPNYCGQTCPGRDKDMKPCEAGRDCCTPRDGNWASWTPWSACSVTCGGGGSRERSRVCSDPSPNECGQPCRGSSREMQTCGEEDCCVDGNWSQWLPWGSCSATCDAGVRSRMRRCDNPTPNFCGMRCPGSSSEFQQCPGNVPCCVDGNWGSWERWAQPSVTCGTGLRSRRRRCDNPMPNYCGQLCPGDMTQNQTYDTGIGCCVDGNWGSWFGWSRPTVSCGLGTRERRRPCNNPSPNYCGSPCPGSEVDVQQADTGVPCTPVCINGNWSPWTPWYDCSVTCGFGVKKRERSCDDPPANDCGLPCPGSDQDMDRCNPGDCCVNGNWGPWAPWSRPSVTCGTGSRERRRRCDNPSPNFCGNQCPGSGVDTESVNTNVPCIVCVDGNWGQWLSWNQPSVTCGVGTRERRRRCDNPGPNYCGNQCPGPAQESQNYDTGYDCCVDGQWGVWGSWGECSVSCGRGQELRRRVCNSPPAPVCGQPCRGPESDSRPCDNPCPCVDGNWGSWFGWSRPTVSCGLGTRERRRPCNNPSPNYCGSPCQGFEVDVQQVDTRVPCAPVCNLASWGSWEDWCPCDCKSGIISRRRVCMELDEAGRPRPTDLICCGAGNARETQLCDIRQYCPVCVSDCKGRPEGKYSSCSSCRDYLHCTSGQPQVFTCKSNYEWDAFIGKCVVPPSPSCALVSCVTSCDNREDGRYPSCFGCASYLECQRGRELEMRCFGGEEFNALAQRCEPGRSPTCVRTFPEDADFQRDAPADSYFTTSELDPEKQRQLYLELSKEAGVAALYNRSDDDLIKEWDLYHNVTLSKKITPAPKTKAGGSHGDGDDTRVTTNPVAIEGKAKDEVTTKKPTGISKHNKDQRVVKDVESTKDRFICLLDCKHAKEGFYQSCKSCQHYVECRPGNVARHHRCAKNRVWDDKAKKCKRASSTCHPDTLSSFIAAHSNNNV